MLVGDPMNTDAKAVPRGLCYRCEANMQQSPFGGAPCTGSDTVSFPKAACGGGWRVTVTFPSCWDGKNLDSPDHKSHISYPASGTFESGGACPSTHPVKIPQVMYEIMFDTRQFNNKADWPENSSEQPFRWSMNDAKGHGIHGDYLFGWKGDALQKAMDNKCSGDACKPLQRQPDKKAIDCTKGQMAKENIGEDVCKYFAPGNCASGQLTIHLQGWPNSRVRSKEAFGRAQKFSHVVLIPRLLIIARLPYRVLICNYSFASRLFHSNVSKL